MSNVPTWYVRQYADNIAQLLQRKGGKLGGTVSTGNYVGNQASPVDQIGEVKMRRVTSRFAPMGRVDPPTDRRWIFPEDFDLPLLIDSFDKLRLLTQPESAYVQAAVNAILREKDDAIHRAFFADAKTGENGETTTSFPAGDIIAVTVGSSSDTGLNVAKLRAGKKKLAQNHVDLDMEPVYMGINAEQHDDLLNEIQVVSVDFNDRPVLVEGRVTRFLGINFIQSEGWQADSNGDRECPMWVPSGMHSGTWSGAQTNISQRNDLQGEPWQAYSKLSIGATRIEEGRVIKVLCAEP